MLHKWADSITDILDSYRKLIWGKVFINRTRNQDLPLTSYYGNSRILLFYGGKPSKDVVLSLGRLCIGSV